jgi:hypothetical protein
MLAAIREDGQPVETDWPYLAQIPADAAKWQPPASIGPLFRRAGKSSGDTIETIITSLRHYQPVLTLLRLSQSFFAVGADGVVDPAPGEVPDFHCRHAVVAVGFGEVGMQRAVLVRNSWGLGWGLSGYAWLTENFVQPRVFGLAFLKEDLSVSPNPRST